MLGIGSVVNGKYRLVRLLGDGGMGAVYEAQHAMLGTRVAIKVLHPDLGRRSGLVERFLQEARVAAQIRSPHVVQVTDVDRTAESHAYIVMELLEGEPLSSVLDRQRKLSVTIACEYATQILTALEAAHALGVIHRDLKPENVFVTFAGGKPVLKLIDFGIAKARLAAQPKNLTVAGVVMGTAEYMAPEQAQSADKVDARSDVYAAGVMLYEMIAGVRPVSGEDARVIASKVARGEVAPLVSTAPNAPREIAGLVHRAMAARPEMRFATATEMRQALLSVIEGQRGSPAGAGRLAPSKTVELPRAAAASPVPGSTPGARPTPPGSEPHVDTIRAPPIATALASPRASSSGNVSGSGTEIPSARGRLLRSRAMTASLVALPLLLGAGIVALWTGAGSASNTPAPSPSAVSPPALDVKPMASSGDVPPGVPTLLPTKSAGGARHAGVAARPYAVAVGEAGAPAAAATALPAGFPSGLPPFPAILPNVLPNGLAIPSGLPAGFPSGLPSSLPAWPPGTAPPATTPPEVAPAQGAEAPPAPTPTAPSPSATGPMY